MMSVDEILETISKMENWDDLQRIARGLKNRNNSLNQAAMQRVRQKFKMGDRIRIKDEKGKYHSGFFYGYTRNKKKVRFYIYNKEMKIGPLQFEKLEAEVEEAEA